MPTMKDIATVAGCSITTVSHVLNGTRPVAHHTRRIVQASAQRLGYRLQEQPRRAQRRLSLMGMTVSGQSHPELVCAIEQELARAGWLLVTIDTHDDPAIEQRAVTSLLNRRVDGLLLTPTTGWAQLIGPELVARKVPFVLLDRPVIGPVGAAQIGAAQIGAAPIEADQIVVDNEPYVFELVEHLLDLGHRRIAMITATPEAGSTEPEQGYLRAHRRRNLYPDPGLIAPSQPSLDGGRREMLRLLDTPDPPTAVFSGHHAVTAGVLIALRERRRTVPDDVAVVGLDEPDWATLIQPGLTTAAQPYHALGACAVRTLLGKFADPTRRPRTVRIPAYIEHRGSCGCAHPPVRLLSGEESEAG